MRHTCVQAAERLADRAKAAGLVGTTIPTAAMAELEPALGLALPPWLRHIFTEVPLCGIALGHQVLPPDKEDDGILFVEWATAADIRSESLDCYPGIAIRSLGYVNVADNDGSGDPLFVCIHDGDDPRIYRSTTISVTRAMSSWRKGGQWRCHRSAASSIRPSCGQREEGFRRQF